MTKPGSAGPAKRPAAKVAPKAVAKAPARAAPKPAARPAARAAGKAPAKSVAKAVTVAVAKTGAAVTKAPVGRKKPGTTATPAAAPAVRPSRAAPARAPANRPVGRASLSADPSARDWADTGDPDYEPDLPGHSGGPHRNVDTSGRRGVASPVAPPRTFWSGPPRPVDETVVMVRPTFAEPLPAAGPARPPARGRRPARRSPMVVQGLWPALLAAGLAGVTTFGVLPLAVAVFSVQVFLILGALALLDAPAAGGAFFVATGAVVAADAAVLLGEGSISGLAGVVGVGLVGSLAHQLARRDRNRVTESLADTLVVLVVATGASCLLAFHDMAGGEQVLLVSLAAAGAVLFVGRLGDLLSSRPILAVGSTRGWPGLLLGLVAGVAAAGVTAYVIGEPPLQGAALLGLVVASTVATADLAVDLGAAELRSGWRDARRVAALQPTALLLPYAVLGPVALLAGRLLLT